MLRKMRSDFKKYSWTLWLVIIAFLVGFSFTDPFKSGKKGKNDLFSIDGVVVSAEKYYNDVLKTLENYSQQFKNKMSRSLINQLDVPNQVMQRLINTIIVQREAEKMDVSVSNTELSEKIKNYSEVRMDEKRGQVNVYLFREYGEADGRFIGVKRYEEMLAMNRIKVKEFEKERRDEIIREKFVQLVAGALVIDDASLKEKYKKEKDSIDLDLITLGTDRILDKIEVDDNELKTYYENNKEDFKTPEKRKGQIIAFKSEDFKKDVKISERELFNYYRANKESFVIPGKTKVSRILLKYDEKTRDEVYKKAEELLKELTPENFAQKAKDFSQDDKAQQGGDYGYQGWQSFTDQEKSMIESESVQEKSISTPVDAAVGFSILFISEKIEKSQESFDNVKTRIRASLETTQLNKVIQDKIIKVYGKLKDKKDVKAEAAKLDIKPIETDFLYSGDPIKGIDEAGYLSRSLFALKEGETSTPMDFMKGMAIVHLTGIEKPKIRPFEDVKDSVRIKVETQKKIGLAEITALETVKKLNSFKDDKQIEKYLKDNKLNAAAISYRRGNRLSYLPEKAGLDTLIFSLEEKRYSAPIKYETQVAIVKVKSKKISTDSEFTRDKDTFYSEQLADLKLNFFNSYLSRIRGSYKMEFFNEELFEEVKGEILSGFRE
ncbi:MAG: peptidyl-prolyl cis-trans isomerase [Candidatus Aminicenantes bacterium]|nr:peptidyl-prolyl cis-trans isomerase [Candidatus Aminicenantes bacterium]